MVRSFFDPSFINQMMPKQGMATPPAFDMKALMDTPRKNMQTMAELFQLGMESAQNLASRNAEIMGRMAQENSQYASRILTEGTPEQKAQRQAELVRKSYETTIAGVREVNEMISKTSEDVAAIINRRVNASLSEFKSAFDPSKAAAASDEDDAPRAASKKPAGKPKAA